MFLNVVPVRVTAPNGKAVYTYALLDSGSTTHFCDRRLLQALGVEGKPTNVALSTVTCDSQKHNSVSADLMISTLEGEESIPLSDVLSVTNIPASPNVFRPDYKRRWPHLRGLPFPQVEQGDVWLLVGAGAGDLIFPTETRIGKGDQPIAVKTTFGWSLFGPNPVGATVNCVQVNLIQRRDDLLSAEIRTLWETDFKDITIEDTQGTSKEDRYALSLLDNSVTLKDGHYELALPWKPGTPSLPNNKPLRNPPFVTPATTPEEGRQAAE